MKKAYGKTYRIFLIIVFFVVSQLLPFLVVAPIKVPKTNIQIDPRIMSFIVPAELDSAGNLSSASATLSNARLSYYAKVSGAHSAAATTITIQSTGNADNNTNHLFPNDTVSVGPNGGFTVGGIIDSTNFTLSSGITVGASDGDAVYSTQSGTLTVNFYTPNAIPTSGDVLITLDDPASGGNDGAPDTAASTTTNGFDLNGITTSEVTCPAGFTVGAVTAGSGSGHLIRCDWGGSGTLPAGANLSIVIGTTSTGLVNPAPVTSGHTQGTADAYVVNAKTRDGSDNTIDQVDMKVAPVESVLVSATVDESISFAISGVSASTSICGQTADITTTATSVPWGTISTADSFLDGAQELTVSTNASSGYSVKMEENDQMGKDGITCTGATAGESVSCIQDSTCNATGCSESTSQDWTAAATYHGLGYSMENVSGTDASFTYSESSRTYSAKQIADQEASETKQVIMTNTAPVSSKQAYVCYRIAISGTQPAGYYYNKVKYTTTATF